MSFIYPRTVTFRRATATAAVGDRGYGAQRGQAQEAPLFSGKVFACSIQSDRGKHQRTGLPTDAREQSAQVVFIPRSAGIGKGALRSGDIMVDDAGARYAVTTPNWTSLGMQIRCVHLEV